MMDNVIFLQAMTNAMLMTLLVIQNCGESYQVFREGVCVVTQGWTSYKVEEVLAHANPIGIVRTLH